MVLFGAMAGLVWYGYGTVVYGRSGMVWYDAVRHGMMGGEGIREDLRIFIYTHLAVPVKSLCSPFDRLA